VPPVARPARGDRDEESDRTKQKKEIGPYSSAVAEFGKYVEASARDMSAYSRGMAQELFESRFADVPRGIAATVRIALGLQAEAAVLTGDPEFEVIGVRERAEFGPWAGRVRGRFENKEMAGSWLLQPRLQIRGDMSKASLTGPTTCAGTEWTWKPNISTIVAEIL
jgi:hypothetical protein